jgi:predicted N-acetyltransferase YhbS
MAEERIETTVTIAAPPERVWAVLTDFARMPDWNPLIGAIGGPLHVGARLSVLIALPGRPATRFRPLVLAADPGRELRWRGSLVLPGLFDGEHYFLLQPDGAGGVRVVHGEVFTGLLVGVIMRSGMVSATREGFEAVNRALKREAEAKASVAQASLTRAPPEIRIEEERPEHCPAIDALTRAVFGGDYEADLMDRLRSEGLVTGAFVALDGADVVGHIALSDLPTEVDGRRVKAACVAPLTVSLAYRKLRIGARLVDKAVGVLRAKGYEAAFVIGDSQYYSRFGFSTAPARKIASPFPSSFMALELVPGALDGTSGSVRYPRAFQLE